MVKSKTPEDFWNQIDIKTPEECWYWTGIIDKYGYGYTSYQGKRIKAHRLAHILAIGPIPENMLVLHSCNHRSCCNWHHIRSGTHKENMEDRTKAGNTLIGERGSKTKLKETQVLEIRALYATGKYRLVDLAKMFCIRKSNVGYIVSRDTWKHI